MVSYTVRQVPIERTFALRKAVLRPHLGSEQDYLISDDFDPTTVAFAALREEDNSVISVARVAPEPPPFDADGLRGWRLRSMATDPSVRNQGVGGAVLQSAIEYTASRGGGIFWCNARVPAKGLYARGGLETWGEVWEEPDIGPHIVMWRRVEPA